MPGPTPISATHRISVSYTVSLFTHTQRHLCDAVVGSGASGFDLLPRPGFSAVDVDAAAQALGNRMGPFLPAGSAFAGYVLEELVSGEYIPQFSGSISAAVGVGTFRPAFGYVIVGKSSDNRTVQIPTYEGDYGTPTKVSNYASLAPADKLYVDFFFNVTGTAGDTWAYNWKRSRGDLFMRRWLAIVIDSNEKLRRKRHIK